MATTTRLPPGSAAGPVDRNGDDPQDAPGAGGVGADTALTYPEWRIEELARKYDDNEHEERYERGFYHPFG